MRIFEQFKEENKNTGKDCMGFYKELNQVNKKELSILVILELIKEINYLLDRNIIIENNLLEIYKGHHPAKFGIGQKIGNFFIEGHWYSLEKGHRYSLINANNEIIIDMPEDRVEMLSKTNG